MRLVLFDQTNGATTSSGEKMTPEVLAQIAEAITIQMNRDYGPQHGGNYLVRPASGPTDLQPGEDPFLLLPQVQASGVIAYHDKDGNGVPCAFDAITLSDTLTGPGNSVSVAIAHECLETAGDPGCNLWADDGANTEYAREMCDAVEDNSYPINGIYVSDFVLPSFFVVGSKGPYSFMELSQQGSSNVAPGPFKTSAGGYQIERVSGTAEKSVQAMHAGFNLTPAPGSRAHRRLDKRAHPQSRQARRGLREGGRV